VGARWTVEKVVIMNHYLAVGIGGCLGSLARYWLSGVVQRHSTSDFPYGTLAVNLLGCLIIGWIIGLVEYRQMFGPNVRLFLTIGILGGFTTFSAFGYETFALLRDKQHLLALGNVTANVVIGVLAVMAGWFLAKLI
jgi:fluoride exporter